MRVALVHELLTMRGGAERVLRTLAAMFPDAPIYTLLYDEQVMGDWFPASRVRTSGLRGTDHHLYLRQFPSIVEAWPFDRAPSSAKATAGGQGNTETFDLVISSSSAFVHGIITNGAPKHLCYVHSPARYLWDRTHDVQERAGRGLLGPLKRMYLSRLFHTLRIWDSEVADRPDMLLAASKEVQRRIELYWRRESTVVYPPVDDMWFKKTKSTKRVMVSPDESMTRKHVPSTACPEPCRRVRAQDDTWTKPYYLISSTLSPYKRIDLAIEACNQKKVPLKIAGDGPARASLQKIAGPTIEFLRHQSEEALRHLYTNAKVLIVPGEEDFCMAAVEAMACGTPVIAYKKGGPLEIIEDGVTGTFFTEPTAASLEDAIARFEKMTFDTEKLRTSARRFSRERFEEEIRKHVGFLFSLPRGEG